MARMPVHLRVGAVRRERGVTQLALAKRLGIKQSALSRLERRTVIRRLDVQLLQRIAKALGVPLKRLLRVE